MGRMEEGDGLLFKAEEQWRRTLAIAEAQLARNPDKPELRKALADCNLHFARIERELGRMPEALAAYRRARQLVEIDPQSWCREAADNRTSVFRHQEPDDTLAVLHHSSALMDECLGDDTSRLWSQVELARILYWTAVTEDHLDHAADAVRNFQRAAELLEGLDRADALAESNRGTLATCYHCIGRLDVDNGRPSDALEPFRRAIAIREALHRSDPVNITHRDDCAGSWHRLGEAIEDLGRPDDAAAAYQKGLAYRRLIALAASRFETWLRERADVEVVVLSAYKSFFLRNNRGEFDLAGWDELWALLTIITLRKCRKRRSICLRTSATRVARYIHPEPMEPPRGFPTTPRRPPKRRPSPRPSNSCFGP